MTNQEITNKFKLFKTSPATFFVWLSSEPIEIQYLFVKAIKLANQDLFYSTFVPLTVPSSKKMLLDILDFYEANSLAYCHPVENGKSPIELYFSLASKVFFK